VRGVVSGLVRSHESTSDRGMQRAGVIKVGGRNRMARHSSMCDAYWDAVIHPCTAGPRHMSVRKGFHICMCVRKGFHICMCVRKGFHICMCVRKGFHICVGPAVGHSSCSHTEGYRGEGGGGREGGGGGRSELGQRVSRCTT
jgi:hypothetical protein